jgi:hypothetical protein
VKNGDEILRFAQDDIVIGLRGRGTDEVDEILRFAQDDIVIGLRGRGTDEVDEILRFAQDDIRFAQDDITAHVGTRPRWMQ